MNRWVAYLAVMVVVGCGPGSSSKLDAGSGDTSDVGDATDSSNCPMDCDDDDPCTVDTCNSEGECEYESIPGCGVACTVSGQCDDKNLCTSDSCEDEECSHSAISCDDQDACTDDACEPTLGCLHVPSSSCLPTCTEDEECGDGNPCTSDLCNTDSGTCSYEPVSCPDPVDPCMYAVCNPSAGGCGAAPDPDCAQICTSADDCPATEDPCKLVGCTNGLCGTWDKTCDDAIPCTADSCVADTGACVHEPIADCSFDCETNDDCYFESGTSLCIKNYQCIEQLCVFEVEDCDDADNCSEDSCDPTSGCLHSPIAGCNPPCATDEECADDNKCTIEGCQNNFCLQAVIECNDGNICTADSCNPASGCVHEQLSPCPACQFAYECDDLDPCSLDSCVVGICVVDSNPQCQPCEDATCNDGNPCTYDSCVDGYCTHDSAPLEGETCNDGDPCTSDDRCVAGSCLGALPTNCVDDDPCTQDLCLPQSGCTHPPSAQCMPSCAEDSDCADANECTLDICVVGVCVYKNKTCHDQNPCTDDLCIPETGDCNFVPSPGTCNDGNLCTVNDQCDAGTCIGSDKNCGDGDDCTVDTCQTGTGACTHTPTPGCGAGGCSIDLDCADFFFCTTDSCDASTGQCSNAPVDCDDDNPCTDNACDPLSGSCLTIEIDCDDQDPCTTDSCVPETGGCIHEWDPSCGSPCTTNQDCLDGLACTIDLCGQQICFNSPKLCDDGDECTEDSCDPANGNCNAVPIPNCCPEGESCD